MDSLTCLLVLIIKLIHVWNVFGASCPPSGQNAACLCYNFEDGLFLECQHGTADDVKTSLKLIKYPIRSLNIYHLDVNVTEFPSDLFSETEIQYLQISHSEISNFSSRAFNGQHNNLHSLSVVNSKLSSVPRESIKKLKYLKILDLGYNYIKDVPSYSFYGLSITNLNLQNNEIGMLLEYSFAGLEESLTELSIGNNKIEEFPLNSLRRLRNLVILKIMWNSIGKIRKDKFVRLTSLKTLDIGCNQIEQIRGNIFWSMPSLSTLSLYMNKIRKVGVKSFESLTELESLDLSRNNIIDLQSDVFSSVVSLRTLDLSFNHLHTIGQFLQNLPSLKELFLAENNIRYIDNDTFANSTNISILYLQDNAIEQIESGTFADLKNLIQLQLSNNFLLEIPTDLLASNEDLQILSLDQNRLETLLGGTFEHLSELRELRLQNNRIRYLQKGMFHSLPQLRELHLQDNRIEVIEDDALESVPNLRHLNLKNNDLRIFGCIFNRHESELQYLQLDGNKITNIRNDSLRGLGSLELLRLNDNGMKRIARDVFQSTFALQNLYLNGNNISSIEDEAFTSLMNLWYLNIDDNRIAHITKKTFIGLNSLKELYLSRNKIAEIELHSFHFLNNLETFHLSADLSPDSDIFSGLQPVELILEDFTSSRIELEAFEPMSNLKKLEIRGADNVVFDVGLLKSERLGAISFADTKLTFTGFADGTRIESRVVNLALKNCSLRELREDILNHMRSLSVLRLDHNHLSELPSYVLWNHRSLQEMHLEANNFSRVPHSSLGPTLRVVNLASNRLVRLDSESFGSIKLNVRALNVSANFIREISDGVFHAIQQLETLDLSRNLISSLGSDVFSHLEHLSKLIISFNRLLYISNAIFSDSLTSLEYLNIADNPIVRLREDLNADVKLSSMNELLLFNTNLSILTSHDFKNFPKITKLKLSHNSVSRVSPGAFNSLRVLQALDLADNKLDILPSERLSGLSNLVSLNLSMNNLQRLTRFDETHRQLVRLDVSRNRLTKIFSWNFSPLVQLKLLFLQHNSVSWIHKDALVNLTGLKELDISFNKLSSIDGGFLDAVESTLRILNIDDNPFECDCAFSTSWLWIQSHRKLLQDQKIVCVSPTRSTGRSIWEHNFEYFCAMPLISELEIQPLRHDQLTVQWRVRNQSKVRGVKIVYHSSSEPAQLSSGLVRPPKNKYNIHHLRPSTWYTVCIVAMATDSGRGHETGSENAQRCVKIKTPEKTYSSRTNWTSIAIILGCTLAVLLVLGISITLTVVKFYKTRQKRRSSRRAPKNDVPQEYLSYRHFSLQSINKMFE
ncbi:Uncharacterised protein g8646 [Pycnogonum litorale]